MNQKYPTVITHADADGILCFSIFLKKIGNMNCRVYFSPLSRLKETLCFSIMRTNDLDRLYLFDLTANREALILASIYKNTCWIDHHIWPNLEIPKNVEVVVKRYDSAAQLVAEYFKVNTHLVRLANEIDKNNVKSEDAEFLRNLVGALRWKTGVPSLLNNKFKNLAKHLAFSDLKEFERSEKIAEIIQSYLKWINGIEKSVLKKSKFFKIDSLNVAVYETMEGVPVYVVNNTLLKHEKAPFDVVAIITRRINIKNKELITRIDLRTQTNKNIYKIAKFFGGGGHKVACAATLQRYLSLQDFLNTLRRFSKNL
jgi:oligoribonuclease NrnB/cAMP/cGMP phosphodiesterase (DHH superfamily)